MSDHRRLTDADLIAQLRWRSRSRVESDLSVRDFVVGVGTKIDSGTAPVTIRRLPALAGLAGVAAILFVLVVALPRLTPGGPSASPGPTGAPPSTIGSMRAEEFASRVAAGELRGETVLVNGRIASTRTYGPRCAPPGQCYLGDLEGTDPPLEIQFRWLKTMAGEGTEVDEPGADAVWGWWDRPTAPLEGVLGLSVDSNGSVMFLGRTSRDEIASSLNEIPAIDLASITLDEIRVVPAWLTGIVAPISCAPPDPGTYIRDLPGRYCGNPSWLAPDPVRVDPNGHRIPEDWLQVQSNAYLDFAPAPAGANGSAEPRAGFYVIAKRLEGSGCPGGVPPCWQWQVIGQVTINADGTPAEPLATTPTSEARTVVCAPLPDEGAYSAAAAVFDETGLVERCEALTPTPGALPLVNPGGDPRVLQIQWSGTECDAAATFRFRPTEAGYELAGQHYAGGCRLAQVDHALRLHLDEPVDIGSVVSYVEAAPAATPTPAPTPIVSPEPIAAIDCPTLVRVPLDDETTWRVLMQDETGLIDSCTRTSTLARVGDPPIVVSNTDGTSLRLLVEWEESPCINETPFQFRRLGDGYELIVERPSVTCAIPFERRAMYFDVKQPVLADLIAASIRVVEPEPTATPKVVATPEIGPPPADTLFECAQPKAAVGAVVIDPSGLVDSCVTVEATGEGVGEDPVVRNPNGTLTELQIEWPGTPCDAAVAFSVVPGATGISIEIGPRPDGKTLGEDGICIQPYVIHAIRLQLSGRVDARNVWIARTAAPTSSIRTISCDDSEFALKDTTGLVVSCRATAVDREPADGNPLITNPGGETFLLHVYWLFQDPSACGPEPPSLALEFRQRTSAPGFAVSTAADFVPGTGCFNVARWFGLEIVLSWPVPSSDVSFAPTGSGPSATAKTQAGLFDLLINAENLEYSTGEPMHIDAYLQYNGGQPSVELWGVDSLVNGFGIKQLDGPLAMGPGWDEPCVRHALEDGQTLRVLYEKSAAWSDDDPNAAFYRDWVDDPELRLPAGTWLITAYSEFTIGSDCAGPLVSLQASLVIVVR